MTCTFRTSARPEKIPKKNFLSWALEAKKFEAAQVVMSSQKVTTKGGKNLDPREKRILQKVLFGPLEVMFATCFQTTNSKCFRDIFFPLGRSTMGYAGMPVQKWDPGKILKSIGMGKTIFTAVRKRKPLRPLSLSPFNVDIFPNKDVWVWVS